MTCSPDHEPVIYDELYLDNGARLVMAVCAVCDEQIVLIDDQQHHDDGVTP